MTQQTYPGVAQLVARLTGGQEAVSSSLATRTMRSVLIGSEYPVMDTPHFLCSKIGHAFFAEQAPFFDTKELDLVPGELVDIALGHPPFPAYPGQTMD